jgi:HlyD family secretion protein
MAKSKRRRKILVFSGIVLVLAGLGIAAALKKREPVITVQVEKAAVRDVTELVVANGKLQPVVQVKISPEVSGEIIELPLKEGQNVSKGDLILRIKPDFYLANRNQATASHKASLAGKTTAEANLRRAQLELKRNEELMKRNLISDSMFLDIKTQAEVAEAQLTSAMHQVEMSKALLERAEEELSKTTIVSPLTGTISKLNSQLGERVVGTATMAGTEVMTIADLDEMEARVDIGETDVVLIAIGQKVRMEVDAFKDRKFNGIVTEIGNSSKNAGMNFSSQQEATKFEVRIRMQEKETFRPGMSVTAEIETRSRPGVLTVPIASVTTRLPIKPGDSKDNARKVAARTDSDTNAADAATNSSSENLAAATTKTNQASAKAEKPKEIECVFVKEGDLVKMVPVKIGISDDSYWEITDGLKEGQEVVIGPHRAISRELQDSKKIKVGVATPSKKGKSKDKDES